MRNGNGIRKSVLDDGETLQLLRRALLADRRGKLVWTISDNAALWDDRMALREFMRRDFGKHCIFLGLVHDVPSAIFVLMNIDDEQKSAIALVWVDPAARRGMYLPRWGVACLEAAVEYGIGTVYVRIKKRNAYAYKTATRGGFRECSGAYVRASSGEPTWLLSRGTGLTDRELNIARRYIRPHSR